MMTMLPGAALAMLGLLGLLCAPPVFARDRQTTELPTRSEGLSGYLASDGTLLLPDGFVGSLDPQGHRMSITAGGQPRFAKGDGGGGGLFGVPSGCDGSIHALAVTPSGRLFLGGAFSFCGDVQSLNVIAYDPLARRFEALGVGVDDAVTALAVSGEDVYVGGSFSLAGGRPANHVARWNGSAWSALGAGAGNGVNGVVNALAMAGSDLYVGGSFAQAGGLSANGIARWNGSGWSSLGTGQNGVDGDVFALAVSGDELFVGGLFFEAGGAPANSVASWNGSSWSSLGSNQENGLLFGVRALAVSGDVLYAGGEFDIAGGQPAFGLASWDGSRWQNLRESPGRVVQALAADSDTLYAAGSGISQTPCPNCNRAPPAVSLPMRLPRRQA